MERISKQPILHYTAALFFLLMLFCSCASIPREAPLLSQELGKQVQELESSHLSLVRIYFENERRQVRKFIEEKWLPAYAGNFFEEKNISEVWDQVVESQNKGDRLEFILRTAPVLQQEINDKYRELIDPLDRLEAELAGSIREKYTSAKSINNAITSYLHSAADVEENRQRYLDMMGVTDQKINTVINDVESFTTELTEIVTGADANPEDFEEQFENYKERINRLIANL